MLSEIVICCSAEQSGYTHCVFSLVSELIERGQSGDLAAVKSVAEILNISKENKFNLMEGVDRTEVSIRYSVFIV
jgi:hypothetical protein